MYSSLKRSIDVFGALLGLILFSPVLLAAAIAIRIKLREPALFRQVRAGINGLPFTLYKLRTMRSAADPQGRSLPDADRITYLGRWLRAASIDELPQLWNVLRGDMSLVGPRPLLLKYLPRYTPAQFRRHEVRPGITGWSQVQGRNDLGWEQRFANDVWYVDHRNLRLDLRILWLTAAKVFRREGISREGHATMPEFLGSSAHSQSPHVS